MAFGLLTTKWRKLRSFLNYSTPKNTQIIRVCTKLHNFIIHMAQAEGNRNGRIGQFHEDNVNRWMYGIEPMGAREFGYLPSSNVDNDDTSLYSLLWRDYDSGRHKSCMADVLSTGSWCPRFNINRNNINSN
jgi:hypothetical protein